MASVTLNSETTATCQSQERPVMPEQLGIWPESILKRRWS